MSIVRSATAAAVAALGLLFAAPAAAQFDPRHSHLECYQIRDKSITKELITEDQFGRLLIAKLTPALLCLPTQKTCCQPSAAGVCVPTTCPTGPIEPSAVPHFKCYKVSARACLDPTCTKVTGWKSGSVVVNLEDQFGPETNIKVGRPQLLCAPVEKKVVSTTTTTTTPNTTSTTLQPCKSPTAAGLCGGSCPPQTTCLATSPTSCDCVPVTQHCTGVVGGAAVCGGLCPGVGQTCVQPSPTAPCACAPACGQSAPACNGACSTGQTCVHLATGACTCD